MAHYCGEAVMIPAKKVEVIYGINKKTLANWRSLGKGPVSIKIGNRCYYKIADVERWIDKSSAMRVA